LSLSIKKYERAFRCSKITASEQRLPNNQQRASRVEVLVEASAHKYHFVSRSPLSVHP